jgi:hypothetical protein
LTPPGGDGDFFHISEAKKTTLQDIVVYGLLTPKERCGQEGTHWQQRHSIDGTPGPAAAAAAAAADTADADQARASQ